jgi:hypothetical protein
VIVVVVGEHYLAHVAQIEMKVMDVREDGLGPRSCVDENAVAIGFDQSSKTPFADSLIGEHGRENGYFQLLYDAMLCPLCVKVNGKRGQGA